MGTTFATLEFYLSVYQFNKNICCQTQENNTSEILDIVDVLLEYGIIESI